MIPFSKIGCHAIADRLASSFLSLETVKRLLNDVQKADERTAVFSPSENDSSLFDCSVFFPVAQDDRTGIYHRAKKKKKKREKRLMEE